jgi:tRNA G18 (ribose-2'-O)-methylase SpoU
MNYVGYKFFDEAKTRRSAEVLHMNKDESLAQFQKRCRILGYECLDKRNVIDRYKLMSDDLIRGDLNERRFNYSILLQNLAGDFNKASVIRNNNAFCGKEVIIFGDKSYDRRGTCGMHLYENFNHVRELSELDGLLERFDRVIGIDNCDGAKPIQNYDWDYNEQTLFVFGEEGIGVCPEILERCDDILYIPQFGAVRSINVACASAIVMYEYTRNFS